VAPITYLTTIEFGAGALSTLPDQLTAVGMTRPLIVSDRGLAATGLIERIERLCPPGSPVFLDVPANPTEAASRAALAVYQAHRCDGICAVGGGSPIDLAKCVALLAGHSGPLESYAAIYGGISRITGTIAPVIAIPTTEGTGSEVGRAALITLDDGRKLGFISPHLIPRRAVCDPELTIGLPPF
jgi:4-hydroxybutyrate dehydrogenase